MQRERERERASVEERYGECSTNRRRSRHLFASEVLRMLTSLDRRRPQDSSSQLGTGASCNSSPAPAAPLNVLFRPIKMAKPDASKVVDDEIPIGERVKLVRAADEVNSAMERFAAELAARQAAEAEAGLAHTPAAIDPTTGLPVARRTRATSIPSRNVHARVVTPNDADVEEQARLTSALAEISRETERLRSLMQNPGADQS